MINLQLLHVARRELRLDNLMWFHARVLGAVESFRRFSSHPASRLYCTQQLDRSPHKADWSITTAMCFRVETLRELLSTISKRSYAKHCTRPSFISSIGINLTGLFLASSLPLPALPAAPSVPAKPGGEASMSSFLFSGRTKYLNTAACLISPCDG